MRLIFQLGEIRDGVIQFWKFVHYQMSKSRVLEIQFVCFAVLFRYYKDSTLCVKCLLDGIPTEEKPSDEQTNAILEILGK